MKSATLNYNAESLYCRRVPGNALACLPKILSRKDTQRDSDNFSLSFFFIYIFQQQTLLQGHLREFLYRWLSSPTHPSLLLSRQDDLLFSPRLTDHVERVRTLLRGRCLEPLPWKQGRAIGACQRFCLISLSTNLSHRFLCVARCQSCLVRSSSVKAELILVTDRFNLARASFDLAYP